MIDIESMVPENHLVRKIERIIDFEFIRELVKGTYSETIGRPSVDPVVLVKIVFIQFLFGIRSMRQTIKEIEVNLAYRWFLGYGFTESIPHFSTFGKNYVRRFADNELFEKIFQTILKHLVENGLVKEETVFVDSTHIKAYANKRNIHNEYLEEDTSKYVEELNREINEERVNEGKKPINFKATRKVAVSNVDPESGMFHKGEKERQLAYSVQTVADESGYVLAIETTPGNAMDGIVAPAFLDKVTDEHGDIRNVVMDAGYVTPVLPKMLLNKGVVPVLPYTKPKGKKVTNPQTKETDFTYTKYYFKYNEEGNYFICPWLKKLMYKGVDSQGYKEYKTSKKDCKDCPYKYKCTNQDTKSIKRHFLENIKEYVRAIRLSDFGKELYPKRQYTIERTFAQGKMCHCLGFTLVRGLKKNHDRNLIVFAAANLKKLAFFVAKTNKEIARIGLSISSLIRRIFSNTRKKKKIDPRFLFLGSICLQSEPTKFVGFYLSYVFYNRF